jgi:ring-1,2-phenylacetyl-CoA epoxidase subunit PaaC
VDFISIKTDWLHEIKDTLAEATLVVPAGTWFQTGSKKGNHTEFLGPILAEMQYLQRLHPGAKW